MTLRNLFGAVLATVLLAAPAVRAADMKDPAELKKLLETLDDRQRNGGDYKSLMYIEQKEKDKTDVVREAVVYRRDAKDQLMILMTRPKGEAGKGYMRLEKNLWSYDPNTGKWDRRTERERIAGTDSRRADFDESRLAEEFDPAFEGEEKLGKFTAWKLVLTARPGVDVAYPVVHLWVDKDTSNILKRQEFALSKRLMRTSYYPKWMKVFSESKKADVWFPQEMRFYDEVEKANSTVIVVKNVDLKPLEENIFTKAWLESKSR
ncbi:MAG TPA: outer membrane lipoprotein-sorting protein [Archangium sp.]|uniref:outer membrane lipoprotein-sorting protein n=1 Tax=Archangium sp. TaxID=1872627 RepID=UPI002E361EE1|nr:outer membrane lipoprotein-sorting protein [Archangium sp.]HEX5744946.1 outer membrane lipoprotein-sorting protein [Archangium sp.]